MNWEWESDGERRDMWEEEYEMRITWLPFGDMVSHVLILQAMFSEPPFKTGLGDELIGHQSPIVWG
jgi:hypothetical protein